METIYFEQSYGIYQNADIIPKFDYVLRIQG